MESTLLYENCGYDTTALIKLSLYYKTSCISLWISLELHHISCEKNHLKELVDTLSGMSRYRNKYSAAAPVLRDQVIF